MAVFKDNAKQEWMIELDAPLIKAVRKECAVDLVSDTERPYERLYDDPILLVDTLWVLCRVQAQQRQIDQDKFAQLLTGDAIDSATEAILGAIVDFSPSRKREILRTLAAKTSKIRDLAMSRAMERLNDPELEAKLLAAADLQTERAIQEALTRLESPSGCAGSSA